MQTTPVTQRQAARPLYKRWKYVLDTCNPPPEGLDFVSRWLLIVRACVFQMTLTSAFIGGMLAAADMQRAGLPFNWAPFVLSAIGLVIAHAVNNMVNDYFDTEGGVDTEDYTRALYAPHPILSGIISKTRLRNTILAANAVDVLIGVTLLLYWGVERGWPLIVFALGGLFISVFYVAPPIRLKHHGLGEPGVFVVWGPLMIGGVYYAVTGAMRPEIFLAGIPYALVVTTVLIGKHIDKLPLDKAKRIHTLPVILGERFALRLNKWLMASFYVITAILIVTKIVGPWAVLVVFAIPRLIAVLKLYSQPKPEKPPENYPVWPLWFVSWAFYHNKLAGGLFVLGLILNLIVPVKLPF
ncbi:MAG TPA: prenyltransferase [Anaerolineae bacterium]|nr:prenyltransferase [Anaerolineae bacterium]